MLCNAQDALGTIVRIPVDFVIQELQSMVLLWVVLMFVQVSFYDGDDNNNNLRPLEPLFTVCEQILSATTMTTWRSITSRIVKLMSVCTNISWRRVMETDSGDYTYQTMFTIPSAQLIHF
jgi:energy-coupling factor transporter transmembrane protein EcfT